MTKSIKLEGDTIIIYIEADCIDDKITSINIREVIREMIPNTLEDISNIKLMVIVDRIPYEK